MDNLLIHDEEVVGTKTLSDELIKALLYGSAIFSSRPADEARKLDTTSHRYDNPMVQLLT